MSAEKAIPYVVVVLMKMNKVHSTPKLVFGPKDSTKFSKTKAGSHRGIKSRIETTSAVIVPGHIALPLHPTPSPSPPPPLHQAEFWVVPDKDKDGRNSYRALEIETLPPGTLVLEEQIHESLQGTVERAPTVPQRSSFGGGGRGRDAGDGGAQSIQPGAGRFVVPAAVCPDGEERGEDAGGDGKDQTVVVASLHPKVRGGCIPRLVR